MIPLNIYLEHADDAQRAHAMREYGDALKELAAVNIFAGDLLFKNFGVTRFGRVVFYDYDEIEYLTDCNFRRIPPPPPGLGRHVGRRLVSGRAARHVPRGIRDVPAHRPEDARVLPAIHADLLDAAMVAGDAGGIRTGRLVEVLSYPDAVRFPPPVASRSRGRRRGCMPHASRRARDAATATARLLRRRRGWRVLSSIRALAGVDRCVSRRRVFASIARLRGRCGDGRAAVRGLRDAAERRSEQEAAKNTFACQSGASAS